MSLSKLGDGDMTEIQGTENGNNGLTIDMNSSVTVMLQRLVDQLGKNDQTMDRMEKKLDDKQEEINKLHVELIHYKSQDKKLQLHYDKICRKYVLEIKAWSEKRHFTVQTLYTLADGLEKKRNDTDIADLSGSVVGVVGSAITVVGLVLLPFTAGASTVLLLTGLGVGAAGGATNIGAGISDVVIGKSKLSDVESQLAEDHELTKTLLVQDEKRVEFAELLADNQQEYDDCVEQLKQINPDEYEKWQKKNTTTQIAKSAPDTVFALTKIIFTAGLPGFNLAHSTVSTAILGSSQVGQDISTAAEAGAKAAVGAGTKAATDAGTKAVDAGTKAAVGAGTKAAVGAGTKAAVGAGTKTAVGAGTKAAADVGTKAAATAGTETASKVGVLASTGAKALYGLSWVGVGLGTVVNTRNIVQKSRRIHKYNKKGRCPEGENTESNQTDDVKKEDKNEKWQTWVKELLIGDNTISAQADKVRQIAKRLQEELTSVVENETIQLLIEQYGNEKVKETVQLLIKQYGDEKIKEGEPTKETS